MGSKWFTANLHFGHENIIRYCHGAWGDRPVHEDMLTELLDAGEKDLPSPSWT